MKHPDGDALIVERARDFLDDYARSGGRAFDRSAVIPLIRGGLRVEICRSRTEPGAPAADDDYTASEVRAFWNLRDLAL